MNPNLELIWPARRSAVFPLAPVWRPARTTDWLDDWEPVLFKQHKDAGQPNLYTETDISYTINQNGFRCIDFEDIPNSSYRVVSTGCSNAEGYGLPEPHTWPSLLCDRIQETTALPVVNLNLGVSASSNRTIALRSVHAFSRLNLDVMVVGWTFPSRILYVCEDGSPRDWSTPTPWEMKQDDPYTKAKAAYFSSLQNEMWDLHEWMVDIMMVEMAASLHNKPVYHLFNWATPQQLTHLNVNVFGMYERRDNDHAARDHFHPGFEYNKWLVDCLWKSMYPEE